MDISDLILAGLGIALGGFLKGATGAGAPVIGVPILALVLNVPTAVAIFAILNLLTNVWQGWTYRNHIGSHRLVWGMAIAGALGATIGSVILATLSTDILMGTLAVVVFFYVGLRLTKPEWGIARKRGEKLAPVAGLIGGVMQGAGGISAPVSITFLNAMKLSRSEFIATISVFFVAMSLVQIPMLTALGILTWKQVILSVPAAVPLFGAIPLGEWMAKRISKQTFDRIVLALLTMIALRLLYGALV